MSYDFNRKPKGILKTVKYQKGSNGKKTYPEIEMRIPRRENRQTSDDFYNNYEYNAAGKLLGKGYYYSNGNAYKSRRADIHPEDQLDYGEAMKIFSMDHIRTIIPDTFVKERLDQRKERRKREPFEKAAAVEYAYQLPYKVVRQESEIVRDPITRKFKLQDKQDDDHSIQRHIANNIQSFLIGPVKNPQIKSEYRSKNPARLQWYLPGIGREDTTFENWYSEKYEEDYPSNAYPYDVPGGKWPDHKAKS